VRDVLFDPAGRMYGLVLAPAPKMGDRRGDRQPHVYRRAFDVDATRRRVTLPHRAEAVRRGTVASADCAEEARGT
jgi:hypothetical protein